MVLSLRRQTETDALHPSNDARCDERDRPCIRRTMLRRCDERDRPAGAAPATRRRPGVSHALLPVKRRSLCCASRAPQDASDRPRACDSCCSLLRLHLLLASLLSCLAHPPAMPPSSPYPTHANTNVMEALATAAMVRAAQPARRRHVPRPAALPLRRLPAVRSARLLILPMSCAWITTTA